MFHPSHEAVEPFWHTKLEAIENKMEQTGHFGAYWTKTKQGRSPKMWKRGKTSTLDLF